MQSGPDGTNGAAALRTVAATRYLTPLREGGSLPAIVEADDDGTYVLKFRGAGQGPRALVAELIAGEIGRRLGLLVPEIVLCTLDPALGRSEPDFEIKALIEASAGLNLALDYLPGSLEFDPLADDIDGELASAIVWFDAYVANPDRTARNTNMLIWHRRLWLIDHGSALYFHHNWPSFASRSRSPFPQIREHVLLPVAGSLEAADAELSARLTPEAIREIVGTVPESWLSDDAEERRAAYAEFLTSRLEPPRSFVQEALDARAQLV